MATALASTASAASSIHPTVAAASEAVGAAPAVTAAHSLGAISLTFIAGLIIVWLARYPVEWLIKRAAKDLPLTPPSSRTAVKWRELTGGNEGGETIGGLERITFFLGFWLQGGLAGAALVAAWLTFKLGSKWQAWTQTIALPESLEGAEAIDYLVARRRWGSHVLATFLVGTLANVLVGMLAGVVAQHLCDLR